MANASPTAPPGPHIDARDQASEHLVEVYQAQGMVMVQLNGTLAQALIRMRTHAHAHNRRLGAVATDVVARRLRFDPERA